VEKGINADESSWCQSDEIMKCRFKAITVGAGLYSPAVCLMDELKRTQTDMMIGVRFQKKPFKAVLHVVTKGSSAGAIADLLDKVARKTPMVEVVRS
jgi:hypothetical protein